MEQSPSTTPEIPGGDDRGRILRYLERYGVIAPDTATSADLDALLEGVRKSKIRRNLGLADDASDEEVEAAKESRNREELLRNLELPYDATIEEVDEKLKIQQEAQNNYERWLLESQMLNEGLQDLTPQEASYTQKLRRGILARRNLGIPDDASEEEYKTARRAKSAVNRKRTLGLADDASEEEVAIARNKIEIEDAEDASPEQIEARRQVRDSFRKRADLDLPANASDEEVAYRVAVWDTEFKLGMHRVM